VTNDQNALFEIWHLSLPVIVLFGFTRAVLNIYCSHDFKQGGVKE